MSSLKLAYEAQRVDKLKSLFARMQATLADH